MDKNEISWAVDKIIRKMEMVRTGNLSYARKAEYLMGELIKELELDQIADPETKEPTDKQQAIIDYIDDIEETYE